MNKTSQYGIGLMSGTSLDGVDICYVKFDSAADKYTFEIRKATTIAYPETWKSRLIHAYSSDKEAINSTDIEYGRYLAGLVNAFIKEHALERVDFIASHGHTIFHQPENGITLQIGDGKTLAEMTGIRVINDFRSQDVKLGGQGAPLVPVGDELLFAAYDYCLNLGGFANISYNESGKRIAFDICPVNMVLNHYANVLGLAYDKNGEIAAGGQVNKALLNDLNSLGFYHAEPPKSLGQEWVEANIYPLVDSYKLPLNDILRTYTEHVAKQLTGCLAPDTSILVTGGGAFNDFLMQRIAFYHGQEINLPDKLLIDFKEALIFAFLGYLKLNNRVNVLSSVTGARHDHVSGTLYEI
ncbi:MAG: anhydro-N-acetylmuramic acid kinase [Flavobacteriaceae bacterium]|nr:anhydro-N-acetylmuramic acid kinase [Flavobacteriaceae bacterium]